MFVSASDATTYTKRKVEMDNKFDLDGRRTMSERLVKSGAAFALALLILGCASPATTREPTASPAPVSQRALFEQDRKAILAMAGDFEVTFDFRETVALAPGYELKKPKRSGAHEIIRIVEDRGAFISLQHLLIVGDGKDQTVVKHWRQDWTYEPDDVLVFIGGNAWETRAVPAKNRAGKWAQEVYQVEDSPRYGAVGGWAHDRGVSQWTPAAEMRPLPRRDMTTRTDYDAVLAVNRHTITPFGWVQEEENSKLVLRGSPHVLAREIGVNTYKRSAAIPVKVADDYWTATRGYWALIRAEWKRLQGSAVAFGLTMQGEPEPLYMPMLELADEVQAGKTTAAAAAEKAKGVMAKMTTKNVGTLAQRLAGAPFGSASAD